MDRLWHDMWMTVNGPDPLEPDEAHSDTAYGRTYLEWKGWDEQNFAQAGSLETSYFNAELKRAGFGARQRPHVLEIGFGNGSFLAYASANGWNATGTEVNRFLVEMATHRGLNAIHADDLNTLADGTFDLVAAFDVLEHIPQENLLEFVRGLVCKLKPEGLLLARFPNADSPFGLVNQNGDITHLSAIGLGKVRYLARELDLKLVFYGGQAVPVTGSLLRSLRRVSGLALFKTVDSIVNRIFFPNDHVAFCSSNAVMVLQVAGQASVRTPDGL